MIQNTAGKNVHSVWVEWKRWLGGLGGDTSLWDVVTDEVPLEEGVKWKEEHDTTLVAASIYRIVDQ